VRGWGCGDRGGDHGVGWVSLPRPRAQITALLARRMWCRGRERGVGPWGVGTVGSLGVLPLGVLVWWWLPGGDFGGGWVALPRPRTWIPALSACSLMFLLCSVGFGAWAVYTGGSCAVVFSAACTGLLTVFLLQVAPGTSAKLGASASDGSSTDLLVLLLSVDFVHGCRCVVGLGTWSPLTGARLPSRSAARCLHCRSTRLRARASVVCAWLCSSCDALWFPSLCVRMGSGRTVRARLRAGRAAWFRGLGGLVPPV